MEVSRRRDYWPMGEFLRTTIDQGKLAK